MTINDQTNAPKAFVTSHESGKKNRKRVVALATVASLIAVGAMGAASASLTNAYTVETNNRVYVDTDLTLEKTPNSQQIIKDITPGQPSTTFVQEVQNKGQLTANWGFYATNASASTLPDVALDNTRVRIQSGGFDYTTTLRGFLTNATVSDAAQGGNRSMKGGEIRTIAITIIPDSTGAQWTEEDFGQYETTFDTVFLASQEVGGTSDLMKYARKNGVNATGDTTGSFTVWTIPAAEAEAASRG